MNSKPFIWVTILILLFSSIIPISSSLEDTYHNTIDVKSINVRDSIIQDAIDNANDGDTIYISSGIYYENIIVDKPLTIIGEGADTTIVDGMGLNEHIFNIISDNVEITGFTIMNCSIGFSGIRVNNNSCNIHNNVFSDCGGGVELWNVENVDIHNNTIEDNTWGIYVHSSEDCSINDNAISNNVYGMELGYSTIEIKNNIIENNSLYGILQLWSNNVVFEYNTFTNHSNIALQLYSSKDNIITGNFFKDNYKCITLDDSCNNTLINNNVSGNRYGIYFWFKSNNNQVEDNIIT